MNIFQKTVLQVYANGEFAHLSDMENLELAQVQNLGDTLLTFLLIELSDNEDCDGPYEATRRVQAAIGQLIQVQSALNQLEIPE